MHFLQLGWTLAIAGAAALALISGGAWLALAGALRPVERMRTQAAAISATDAHRRLRLVSGNDEISMLGATLNQMLDRIQESVDRERRFVDRASHELRTPLAVQRMALDVALAGPQTVDELRAALRGVSEEKRSPGPADRGPAGTLPRPRRGSPHPAVGDLAP